MRAADRITLVVLALGVAACSNDDDGPGADRIVGFTDPCYVVGEQAFTAYVAVERSGDLSRETRAGYATAAGTATAGSDFTHVEGTLTWGPGDTSLRFVEVPITPDATMEPNSTFSNEERLTITLASIEESTISPQRSVQLAIVDDESTEAIALSDATNALDAVGCHIAGSYVTIAPGPTSFPEDATAAVTLRRVPETRSGIAAEGIFVSVLTADGSATAGSDYDAAFEDLEWQAGDPEEQDKLVSLIDDGDAEPTETFGVRLSPFGATLVTPARATLSIADND